MLIVLFVLLGTAHWRARAAADAPPAGIATPATAPAATTATTSTAATAPAAEPPVFGQGVLFPYDLLDAALNERVDNSGLVNYPQLKDDKNLGLFVQAVAGADLSEFLN